VTLRLYMDEDSMSQALVRALRARGVDVLTADEAQMIERIDADHLAYAASQGRTLCTFNVSDFWTLHGGYLSDGRSHAGIVLMPQQRYSVGELLRRLLRLVATLSPEAMTNRAEFISAWDPLG
jgi:hypothetical protein